MADEQKPESSPEPVAGTPGDAKAIPPKPPAASPTSAAKPHAPKAPAVMATTPWESSLTELLKSHFGDSITEFSSYLGQNFLVVRPEAVNAVLEFLKLEADFDYLVDITAVDYPKRAERFDLIYILYSYSRNERIRVKTMIPDGYRPKSATSVHLGADWLEREVFDMFGIEFDGHPHMKRILLPDEWQGHPLRKDYSILDVDRRWVQENLGIEVGQ
jgi:NADH (or F420H2) dehydrogenase, subunit C